MTPDLMRCTEAALGSVGAFGEVRLIVEKGRVRFIEVVHSESLDPYPDTQEHPRYLHRRFIFLSPKRHYWSCKHVHFSADFPGARL